MERKFYFTSLFCDPFSFPCTHDAQQQQKTSHAETLESSSSYRFSIFSNFACMNKWNRKQDDELKNCRRAEKIVVKFTWGRGPRSTYDSTNNSVGDSTENSLSYSLNILSGSPYTDGWNMKKSEKRRSNREKKLLKNHILPSSVLRTINILRKHPFSSVNLRDEL